MIKLFPDYYADEKNAISDLLTLLPIYFVLTGVNYRSNSFSNFRLFPNSFIIELVGDRTVKMLWGGFWKKRNSPKFFKWQKYPKLPPVALNIAFYWKNLIPKLIAKFFLEESPIVPINPKMEPFRLKKLFLGVEMGDQPQGHPLVKWTNFQKSQYQNTQRETRQLFANKDI